MPPSSHPSVLMTGSLFLSSSLSSARSVLKPFSWAALYSGLKTSSSLRLTKQAVWYQRSIRPSWGFSGSTDFLDTRIWSWGGRLKEQYTVSYAWLLNLDLLGGGLSMKIKQIVNLFYFLLTAFTCAAVWFGVLHCKVVQCFFSFSSTLRVPLSCAKVRRNLY